MVGNLQHIALHANPGETMTAAIIIGVILVVAFLWRLGGAVLDW
jgi:hypothetical protein